MVPLAPSLPPNGERLARSFASQFGVSKPLSSDLRHDHREAVSVIHGVVFRGTFISPDYPFSNVAIKTNGSMCFVFLLFPITSKND